jgi:hypothetical protein
MLRSHGWAWEPAGLRCRLTNIFWPHAWILGFLSPDYFFGLARSCTFRVETFSAAIAWLGLGTRRAPLQAN